MRYQKIVTVAETAEEPKKITQALDVVPIARDMIGEDLEIKEYFLLFTIKTSGELISARIVSIGTLNQSLVHPREIFRPAVMDNAAGVIVAHNHPSGQCFPSQNDNRVTKRLGEAGRLLGIELLDHIVVTKEGYYSYSEEGEL